MKGKVAFPLEPSRSRGAENLVFGNLPLPVKKGAHRR
jgi:hypothetical protein